MLRHRISLLSRNPGFVLHILLVTFDFRCNNESVGERYFARGPPVSGEPLSIIPASDKLLLDHTSQVFRQLFAAVLPVFGDELIIIVYRALAEDDRG